MAKPRYALELKANINSAQFMAGGKSVELDEKNPRFETTDQYEYVGLRELPFLKDLGEQTEKPKSKDEE